MTRFGLTIALVALLSAVQTAAADLTGRASVIDGDTIEIAGQRIRFAGVNAVDSLAGIRDSSSRKSSA